MKKSTVLLSATLIAGVCYGVKNGAKKWLKSPTAVRTLGALGVASVLAVAPAYAMSESEVQGFASAMKASANAQNIGQLSGLIDDSAVISLTRQGKTATLDKNGYLQLLQKSWAGAKDYRYDINISDVVISGNQAKAQVKTVESWIKDNKKTTITTVSRTTLQSVGKNAVLLRAVTQVAVE